MDFDQLASFLEVAKQQSFSRAAQKLFRTQPAISAQIRLLEQECGEKLFDRSGKKISLTSAGETLLDYAQRLHQLHRDALQAIAELGYLAPSRTDPRRAERSRGLEPVSWPPRRPFD